MKNLLHIIFAILLLSSCRKEGYNLDVRSSEAILIVDARVESHTGKFKANLSKSTDFLGENPVDYVNDAQVFFSVNEGDEVAVPSFDDGDYELSDVLVDEGTKYDLRIVQDGEEYTSSTEMLEIQPIDFFFFEETPGFGDPDKGTTYNFNMILNIDLSETDYYLTETTVLASSDDELIGESNYLQWDDGAYDSNPALFPYFVQEYPDSSIVNVRFSHIPLEVYEFYNSLSEVRGQDPSSLAPANPTSNISRGAIGSFGAFATFETNITITP